MHALYSLEYNRLNSANSTQGHLVRTQQNRSHDLNPFRLLFCSIEFIEKHEYSGAQFTTNHTNRNSYSLFTSVCVCVCDRKMFADVQYGIYFVLILIVFLLEMARLLFSVFIQNKMESYV